MTLALAVLLCLGMLTTIGIRFLQSLVETPHYTGNHNQSTCAKTFATLPGSQSRRPELFWVSHSGKRDAAFNSG